MTMLNSVRKLLSAKTLIALVAGAAGALLVLYAWRLPPFETTVETTENAYVRGQVTMISPQLAGYITSIPVQDFDHVREGDLLVRIDDRIYAQKLAQAEATLAGSRANLDHAEQDARSADARITSAKAEVASARATLVRATADAARVDKLLTRGAATRSAADEARATLAQARAAVARAEAAVEVAVQDRQGVLVGRRSLEAAVANAEAAVQLARIDLDNTRITAPVAGQLGQIGARVGQYVSPGSQLAAVVPERRWIIANFKEGQIHDMKLGQAAIIEVDAMPGTSLHGHIEHVSPATGSEFSVLKPDNATGNFTKVAQRVPVRVELDTGQPQATGLAPGMSVVVRIDTAG
ncbi:secretion protein HlyD [Tistrella bauzanensis]|uniref:Secretion protein HlyD n=2 Tax=Tistrella bauzanensis TaxID=657419 RepID=A0ABQ1IHC4_9PROT|nr:secretion protein HlyD [Tistrella bauzanensis]